MSDTLFIKMKRNQSVYGGGHVKGIFQGSRAERVLALWKQKYIFTIILSMQT